MRVLNVICNWSRYLGPVAAPWRAAQQAQVQWANKQPQQQQPNGLATQPFRTEIVARRLRKVRKAERQSPTPACNLAKPHSNIMAVLRAGLQWPGFLSRPEHTVPRVALTLGRFSALTTKLLQAMRQWQSEMVHNKHKKNTISHRSGTVCFAELI